MSARTDTKLPLVLKLDSASGRRLLELEDGRPLSEGEAILLPAQALLDQRRHET